MINTAGILESMKQAAYAKAENRVQEIASTIQSVLMREARNDLVFSSHAKYQAEILGVQVNVEKKSDTEFNIVINTEGLSDKGKELLAFYLENAKALAYGGGNTNGA